MAGKLGLRRREGNDAMARGSQAPAADQSVGQFGHLNGGFGAVPVYPGADQPGGTIDHKTEAVIKIRFIFFVHRARRRMEIR